MGLNLPTIGLGRPARQRPEADEIGVGLLAELNKDSIVLPDSGIKRPKPSGGLLIVDDLDTAPHLRLAGLGGLRNSQDDNKSEEWSPRAKAELPPPEVDHWAVTPPHSQRAADARQSASTTEEHLNVEDTETYSHDINQQDFSTPQAMSLNVSPRAQSLPVLPEPPLKRRKGPPPGFQVGTPSDSPDTETTERDFFFPPPGKVPPGPPRKPPLPPKMAIGSKWKSSNKPPIGKWNCSVCLTVNPVAQDKCQLCRSQRKAEPISSRSNSMFGGVFGDIERDVISPGQQRDHGFGIFRDRNNSSSSKKSGGFSLF